MAETTFDVFHKGREYDKFKHMQNEHMMILKLMIYCFLQKCGGTDTVSVEQRVFLYYLIMFEKVNLTRYIFNHMLWALSESQGKNRRRQIPYGRLLSEIFYQGGLLEVLKNSGVVSNDELGTMTGKIINGKALRYIQIVEKAIVEENDMKESHIVSDLMEDFPPISKEDNPEVLAAYVVTYFEETRRVIKYSSIPETASGVLLRVASKKRKPKKAVEGKSEPNPNKDKKEKKAPSLIVTEPALPAIQEEIADLEPIEVLNTRTRGGSSQAIASQRKPKVQKQSKKQVRRLKLSTYTKEEDIADEPQS